MLTLIIDDSRTMRVVLRRTLERLGYETVEAAHGLEAMELLHSGVSPRLCLVDWNMPVMDGLEFVRSVRENPAWRDMVLMMITTESEPIQIANALQAGANEYIIKPFTADDIASKLVLLGLLQDEEAPA